MWLEPTHILRVKELYLYDTIQTAFLWQIIFSDCQNKYDNDKYEFLSILEETIDLDEIVLVSFVSHFHAATDRPRKHLLYPMLKALLLHLNSNCLPPDRIFGNTLRNYGISAAFLLFPMLLNSHGSNRISY